MLFMADHHQTPRSRFFDRCFAGAMMSTHVDSKIEKWVSLDTRQSAECANEWVRGDCEIDQLRATTSGFRAT